MNITIVPPNPIEITIVEPVATALTVNAGSPVEVSVIQSLSTTGSVTNVASENAERILKRVWNNTGSTLTKGTLVYVNGGHGSSDLTVTLADKSMEITSSKTVGYIYEDILNNDNGYVITEGFLQGITTNTVSGAEGSALWLGTSGAFQSEVPVSPDHAVFVGYLVKKAGSGIGSVYAKIQNGYELPELHDVLITTPLDGQLLTYDGVAGLWKNVAPAGTIANLAYLPNNQTFTGNNTFTGGLDVTSATITGLIIDDVTALTATITGLSTSIAGKANAVHTHVVSDVTGLQTDLDNKAALVHTHAIADVTGLQTALDGKALAGHTHPQSDITGLVTDLSNKANISHTHAQSEVTNLVSDLAGKAPVSHTHPISDVVGLQTALDSKISLADNLTFTGTNTFNGSTSFTGGLNSSTTTLSSNTAISGTLNLVSATISGLSSADISDWNDEQLNPNSKSILRDDFIATSAESGELGGLGWQVTGFTLGGADAPSGRPGIITITRSATTGSMYLANSTVAGISHTDDIEYACFIWKDAQITDTTNSIRRIGLMDHATTMTKFIGIQRNNSTQWTTLSFDSLPNSYTPVNAFVADANYHKMELIKIGVNTWNINIDGTYLTTITSTDAPVGSLMPAWVINGSDTAAYNVDFYSMRIGTTSR